MEELMKILYPYEVNMQSYIKVYDQGIGSTLENLSTMDRLSWKTEPEVQGIWDWLWRWQPYKAILWRHPPVRIKWETT
jgi:hypothetical protein